MFHIIKLIYANIYGYIFEKRHWHLILVNPVIACMTYIILIIFPNVNPWGNIAIVIIFFLFMGCLYIREGEIRYFPYCSVGINGMFMRIYSVVYSFVVVCPGSYF